jgi:oligopeptide/dipeptide ABC transporter ATP-binding protein
VPDAIAGRGKPLRAIDGQPPTPGARLPGCAFEPRCALRVAACRVVAPVLQTEADGNNAVACHLHDAGATA